MNKIKQIYYELYARKILKKVIKILHNSPFIRNNLYENTVSSYKKNSYYNLVWLGWILKKYNQIQKRNRYKMFDDISELTAICFSRAENTKEESLNVLICILDNINSNINRELVKEIISKSFCINSYYLYRMNMLSFLEIAFIIDNQYYVFERHSRLLKHTDFINFQMTLSKIMGLYLFPIESFAQDIRVLNEFFLYHNKFNEFLDTRRSIGSWTDFS